MEVCAAMEARTAASSLGCARDVRGSCDVAVCWCDMDASGGCSCWRRGDECAAG
jgi:hypothetical protein